MDKQRVNDIFERALRQTPEQRRTLLRDLRADDHGLAAEVQSLLDALDRAGEFLSTPTVASSDHTPPSLARDLAGSVVGPYKLLELIGEGGFGSVYMAEQSHPIRRRVALKVLKPGMDSRQVIGRFEAERQALALMDHPHIARVLDAGTTAPEQGSLPYFVMELVRGVPITRFCDENRLTPRERLELLIPVCLAVQHAHQKGIIHRDIKPGNVLVTLHDGTPVPKVIDFGIAKATGPALTDRTVFTEFRALIGTPAYMSPEQAEMSGLDIDTRSDVYSLGVLTYELLTGSTPFDTTQLMRAGIAEMQRIIREREPPKPSTRVSTAGDRLTSIADSRRTPSDKLGRIVRGELDWIVMKAMEKERARRYQTANDLAADLQRYLHAEPVLAAPPGAAYRLRAFVRRRRGPVVAAAALLATILLGLVGTSVGFSRARGERDRAIDAEKRQATAAGQARAEADLATRRAYAAGLAAASAAIQSGDGLEARRQLDAIPAERRGWEWRHLSFTVTPWTSERSFTDGRAAELRVSASGRWAAITEKRSGLVHVFQIDSPAPASSVQVDGSRFTAFPSDDGRSIIPVTYGQSPVRCIDVATGATRWTRSERFCVGLLAGGLPIVGDPIDPELQIVDPERGTTMRSIPSGIPILPSGQRNDVPCLLTSGEIFDLVRPWSAAAAAVMRENWNSSAFFAAFGPRPDQWALSKQREGRMATVLMRHPVLDGLLTIDLPLELFTFRFRADGEVLLLSGTEGTRLVSASESTRRWLAMLPNVWVIREVTEGSALAYYADDRGNLFTAPIYGAPSPWEFAAPFHLASFATAISSDAGLLVTGDWGCVTLWDAATGEPRWRRGGWSTFIRAAAISPDSALIAAGAELGRIRIYDARDGSTIAESPPRHPVVPMGLAFTGDRASLLVAWSDGSTQRLRADDLARIEAETPPTGTCIDQLVPSPDGSIFATVSLGEGPFNGQSTRAPAGPNRDRDAAVVVRSAADLTEVGRWVSPDDPPSAAAFSADGSQLAVGTRSGSVYILDPRKPEPRPVLTQFNAQIGALCWSPAGDRLVVAPSDSESALGLLAWVNPANGDVLLTSRINGRKGLKFSADGASLLAVWDVGCVRLETRWPDEKTLLTRDRVKLAMRWLGEKRPWDVCLARAMALFAEDDIRPEPVRRTAVAILEALREQPAQANNHAMLTGMARASRSDTDRERSLELIDAAIAQTPDAPNFRMTRAELLRQLRRHEEAVASLEVARALYKSAGLAQTPLFEVRLAQVRFDQGRDGEAQELLRSARAAIENQPDPELRSRWQAEYDELFPTGRQP